MAYIAAEILGREIALPSPLDKGSNSFISLTISVFTKAFVVSLLGKADATPTHKSISEKNLSKLLLAVRI